MHPYTQFAHNYLCGTVKMRLLIGIGCAGKFPGCLRKNTSAEPDAKAKEPKHPYKTSIQLFIKHIITYS
jgi:hypothetical protein